MFHVEHRVTPPNARTQTPVRRPSMPGEGPPGPHPGHPRLARLTGPVLAGPDIPCALSPEIGRVMGGDPPPPSPSSSTGPLPLSGAEALDATLRAVPDV